MADIDLLVSWLILHYVGVRLIEVNVFVNEWSQICHRCDRSLICDKWLVHSSLKS
jgi:hypothetical protein